MTKIQIRNLSEDAKRHPDEVALIVKTLASPIVGSFSQPQAEKLYEMLSVASGIDPGDLAQISLQTATKRARNGNKGDVTVELGAFEGAIRGTFPPRVTTDRYSRLQQALIEVMAARPSKRDLAIEMLSCCHVGVGAETLSESPDTKTDGASDISSSDVRGVVVQATPGVTSQGSTINRSLF
ncbi:hypothetical protein U8335_20315 [Roseiconus lacunae]|uniref:hypothetical protein n=1 Tax=Roseiconus lacunae TaxID=2605694 RepID=UPI00308E46CC|nr:hypothetical protein U8335_20315 [Stieleria sp. HD01]